MKPSHLEYNKKIPTAFPQIFAVITEIIETIQRRSTGPKIVLEDKKLFTPGPLTTSPGVKNAMLRDMGSRDSEFISTIKSIRQGLLKVMEFQAR